MYGVFVFKELFIFFFKVDEVNVLVMEKFFEKIGDYFNNLEMFDCILVVKIWKDGWEKFEVVCWVWSIMKMNF